MPNTIPFPGADVAAAEFSAPASNPFDSQGLPADLVQNTFGENPWDKDEREYQEKMGEWRGTVRKLADSALLDPDKVLASIDTSFAESPEQARRLAANDMVMRLHLDGRDAPIDSLQRHLLRVQIAARDYNGEGEDSEEAFFAAGQKYAQKRKDGAEFQTKMLAHAADDAMLPTWESKGAKGFLDLSRQAPGYDPELEPDYALQWQAANQEMRERLAPIAGALDATWLAIRNNADLPTQQLRGLKDDQWDEFLHALRLRAETLPNEEKEKFFQGMQKDFARSVETFSRQAVEGAADLGALALAGQMADPQAEMMRMAAGIDGMDAPDVMAARGEHNRGRNRAHEVRRIMQQTYDPIDYYSGFAGILQKTPGVTATSMVMAVPYVGPAIMAASMNGAAQESMYLQMRDAGLDEAAAGEASSTLAPIVMLPQAALERMQFGAWSRKLPVLDKAMTYLGDSIKNRLARFAANTATISAFETVTEVAQDVTQMAVMDVAAMLDKDLPGTDWGAELKQEWNSIPEIAGTMLVLSMFGAAGGLNAEARHRAFATSSREERTALGFSEEQNNRIDQALQAGPASLAKTLDEEWSQRNPDSDEAKAARRARQQRERQALAAQRALDEGLDYNMPKVTAHTDGTFSVHTREGELIGNATNAAGVANLINAHSVALETITEDAFMSVAMMLTAGQFTAKREGIEQQFDLGRLFGLQDAKELGPEHEARFMAQVALMEKAAGGDGSAAWAVFGINTTELRENVKQDVNRYFAGASLNTIFHENWHAARRRARAAGKLTRQDDIAVLRALDRVLAGKKSGKDGQDIRFLPEGITDEAITETMLDEGIAEIAEVMSFMAEKGKSNKHGVSRSFMAKYLHHVGLIAPEATRKLSHMINAIRARMGMALARSFQLKKAIAAGEFDMAELDAYTDKLLGHDTQTAHNAAVQQTFQENYQQEADPAEEGDPFQIGRATAIPNSQTETFQGAPGEMSVTGPASFQIGAWHGTPHKVDKFSLDKVGTGEGAQAYGYGLYFAENRQVAENYRINLAYDPEKMRINGKQINAEYSAIEAMATKRGAAGWLYTVMEGLERLMTHESPEAVIQHGMENDWAPQAVDYFRKAKFETFGNLYRVSLDVDEAELLDWDKPFSEQSEHVKQALNPLIDSLAQYLPAGFDRNRLAGGGYLALLSRDDSDSLGSDRLASQRMLQAGIPGIKYLDDNSRKTGDGSRNYVIFDESLISIQDENGQPVSFSVGKADRPMFASMKVSELRHDKTAWTQSGADPDQAREIVAKYYKPAAFAGIPTDALLVPMPSTLGTNILPDALAARISKDFGQAVERRQVATAMAKTEAKNKRAFLAKLSDPVRFMPTAETVADLKGRKVFIVEDVHNTGESWIAFAKMLQAEGVEVAGIATLVSTEQRITSPRDIERMASKIAEQTKTPLDQVKPAIHSLFNGTFKQLANKAEAEAGRSESAARAILAAAISGENAGIYANPLQDRGGSQGSFLGNQPDQVNQGEFGFSIGHERLLERFGENYEADSYGLPAMPKTLADGDPLLQPTASKATAELDEDHPLVSGMDPDHPVVRDLDLPADHPALKGGWLPAGQVTRNQLRKAIVKFFMSLGQPVAEGEQLTAYVSGGGGGAGKSTILARLKMLGELNTTGAVPVNADDIKLLIPEWEKVVQSGDGRAAAVTHSESSKIAEKLLDAVLHDGRLSFVFDATLANTEKNLERFKRWKGRGLRIHLVGVTIDPAAAMIRAAIRGLDTGRWVPSKNMAEDHAGFNRGFDRLMEEADLVNLYDNTPEFAHEIGKKSLGEREISIVNPEYRAMMKLREREIETIGQPAGISRVRETAASPGSGLSGEGQGEGEQGPISLQIGQVSAYLQTTGAPSEIIAQESERITNSLQVREAASYKQGDLFGIAAKNPGETLARAGQQAAAKAGQVSDDLKAGLQGDWAALAREVNAKGRASQILHQLIDRQIPAWSVVGSKIESPEDVHALMLPLRSPYFESLKVLVLDGANNVVHAQIVTVGSLSESVAHPADILGTMTHLREKLGKKFSSIIISHNHPSGDPSPSRADEQVTRRLQEVAHLAGWSVLDHIVTNGETYFSFREAGLVGSPDAAVRENPFTPRKNQGQRPEAIRKDQQKADWEAVAASALRSLDAPDKIAEAGRFIRNANPDAAHLLFVNTRLKLLSVQQLPAEALRDKATLTRELIRGRGLDGAYGVILLHPQSFDENSQRYAENRLVEITGIAQMRFLDAISLQPTGYTSAREEGRVNEQGPSFSIGRADVAGAMAGSALERVKDPIRRVQAMKRIADDFRNLQLSFQRIEAMSGLRRSKHQLRAEAKAREVQRADELITEVWARFGSLLDEKDLIKLRSQPVHAYIADPTNNLRGRLVSRSAAMKRRNDLWGDDYKGGQWDGSDGISRTLFGGDMMPADMAQNLYDEGLISEPTPDAMWEALSQEQKQVARNKELHQQAMDQIREAKQQAKEEASAWLATQGKEQESSYNPREEVIAGLRMLDALLMALPPEVRGKIGGYTQMARITTDEARLEFLKDKLSKSDAELEQYLRRAYHAEFLALIERASPVDNIGGKRPTGSIDPDAWDMLQAAYRAMTMTAAEVEAEATRLEQLAEDEETTADEQLRHTMTSQLIRLTGNWAAADAARRAAAVQESTRIYLGGLSALKIKQAQRRERLANMRKQAKDGTGKAGSRMQRKAISTAERSKKSGNLARMAWEFLSFGQLVNAVFGETNPVAKWFNERELAASNAYEDGMQTHSNALEEHLEALAGGQYKGLQLRHRLQNVEAITVTDAHGQQHTFTEAEAITYLLMWRQEDGRRHMEGRMDDSGNLESDWGWTDASAAEIEKQLSPEGRSMMAFLSAQYAAEYDRINEVFRRIWNVSLPRHKFYAPLTVKPTMGGSENVLDPVSGDVMGAGMTPGSLKNRQAAAVTEPEFRDAFQVFLTHARQMEHFIAYGEFARDAQQIINRRETRNSVEAVSPTAATALSKWIDYFALGGLKEAAAGSAVNAWVGGALARLSSAALVGRISVLAMQSLQLGAALYKMPVGAYLGRFARLMMGRLQWGDALRSSYIQRRLVEMPPIIRDAIGGLSSGSPNRIKFLAAKAARTIAGADALFTAGTYAILYDYHLSQAKKLQVANAEEYAHKQAELITDQVAQPMRTGARSWLEVSMQNQPAFRALWNFSTDPRQKLALSVYEALRHDKSAGEKRAHFAKTVAVTWLVSGILQASLRAAMRDIRNDDDDEVFDDKNWDLKRLALMATTGPLGGIPFIGAMLEGVIYNASETWRPESQLLDAAGQTARLIPKWAEGDFSEPLRDLEALFTGGATFSGSSAGLASIMHLVRDAWGLIENLEGAD